MDGLVAVAEVYCIVVVLQQVLVGQVVEVRVLLGLLMYQMVLMEQIILEVVVVVVDYILIIHTEQAVKADPE